MLEILLDFLLCNNEKWPNRNLKIRQKLKLAIRRDNISSKDYQVSNVYKEIPGYELYPLHGTPDSLTGLKPTTYESKIENI